ncbi:hypothetical protein BGX26_010302 [Mortierella sp. AD094]|nr:hypothetical protein BGX26_010302 [Mortierella sp. AD094]
MPPKAEPTTTAPKDPKEPHKTTAPGDAHTTTPAAGKGTRTSTNVGTATAIATTTPTTIPIGASTTSNAPSSTSVAPVTNGSTSGLPVAAIGGIAAGAVVIVALVGLLCYKRRRRAVASNENGGKKDDRMYMNPSNYGKKKGPSMGISGPLALAPDDADAPALFINPKQQQQRLQQQQQSLLQQQQQQQQQFSQQERDMNSFGQTPRSPTSPRSPYGNNSKNGNFERDQKTQDGGYGYEKKPYNHNNASQDSHAPLQNDYYDDGLVHDYYGGASSPNAMDQPMTPVPDYYLGKEDIDPRRDLRGLDNPETYILDKKSPSLSSPTAQRPTQQGQGSSSPRSSCSSDDEEGYMTLEQAQKAHQRKMMGHKESIGSVQALTENASKQQQQHQQQQQQQQPQRSDPSDSSPSFTPEHASVAISDSTMSMMPSLPSVSSPMPFTLHNTNNNNKNNSDNTRGPAPMNGAHTRQGSDLHIKSPVSPSRALQRGPDSGPLSPLSQESPYAESSFSEDFGDNRSVVSGTPQFGPNGGGNIGASRPYSPYAPGPYPQQGANGGYRPPGPGYGPGPGYSPGPYNNNGYGPGPNGARSPPPSHMRGPGSPGGYGPPGQYGRPVPGPGFGSPVMGRGPPPPNYSGYPARVASPGPGGYRPPQRDPGYNNQGPYQRAY